MVAEVVYEAEGWGVGRLWVEGGRVVHHELPREDGAGAPARGGPGERHPLAERLRRWFEGGRDDFGDVELDLSGCTPFQLAVIETLRAVPPGETVTYGELAALAGYPNAHRAAGSVCARNRFPLLVPCHRVVAADGLGAFGSLGTGYKRRLLALEAAA